MSGRRPSWNEDHLVPIFRNGRIEEVYWTYGYSPVFDDDGAVGGMLVVCTETTSRVLAERRARTLRLLAERTALAARKLRPRFFDTVIDVISVTATTGLPLSGSSIARGTSATSNRRGSLGLGTT